jgi:predicted acetyltransferase
LDRLVEIHTSAFPDPRGTETRRRNFAANPLGDLEHLHVAELDGLVVGHAFVFPLEAWFGGRSVRFGGIASVGVAPEARGTGVASRLLEHLHEASHARGDAFTLLYAFRYAFYARLGYAPARATRRFEIAPRALESFGPGRGVRAARGDDRPGIVATYEHAALHATGRLARPARLWDRFFADERRVFLVAPGRGSEIAGYAAWSLDQAEAHADVTMRVHEIVANDFSARAELFGAIGRQRDQVRRVILDLDEEDPVDLLLTASDIDRDRAGSEHAEHVLGSTVGGPMLRVHDIERAVAARGYLADGSVDLAIGPSMRRLSVENGSGRLTEVPLDRTRLTLEKPALGAILFGGLAPSRAARIGWLQAEPAVLRAADTLFEIPPFFSLDTF